MSPCLPPNCGSRPPVALLFGGLPLNLFQTIYSDILRPDLVDTRLLRWDADLVFVVWLSAWIQWRVSLLPLLSGSRDADLQSHLLHVDTGACPFDKPPQIDVEPRGSVSWHEDFILHDRTKDHSIWPGDFQYLCQIQSMTRFGRDRAEKINKNTYRAALRFETFTCAKNTIF